jgi:Fe-S cluster assembly protein SufB
VIFLSTDMALQTCPELMKKYFGTVVPFAPTTNSPPSIRPFGAAARSSTSRKAFIWRSRLQSYFRINNEKTGQFERTLIIVDEGADIHYVEGCTAPIYSKESLHAAVVEIVVLKDAHCRYTTVQNWSNNIVNLVTQRALVEENGLHGMGRWQYRQHAEYEISGLHLARAIMPKARSSRSRSAARTSSRIMGPG